MGYELTSSASHTLIKAVQELKITEAEKMGREYASAYEAYSKLLRVMQMAKADIKTSETLHDDVWKAIKEDNEESVFVHLNALGNKALEISMTYAIMAAEAHRAAEELRGKI